MPIHDEDLPSIALSSVLKFCHEEPGTFPFEGGGFKAQLEFADARKERLRVQIESTGPSSFDVDGLVLEWHRRGRREAANSVPLSKVANGESFEVMLPPEVAKGGIPSDNVRSHLLLRTKPKLN